MNGIEFNYLGLVWYAKAVKNVGHYYDLCIWVKVNKQKSLINKILRKDPGKGFNLVMDSTLCEAMKCNPGFGGRHSDFISLDRDSFTQLSKKAILKLVRRWSEWEEWPDFFGDLRINNEGCFFNGEAYSSSVFIPAIENNKSIMQ